MKQFTLGLFIMTSSLSYSQQLEPTFSLSLSAAQPIGMFQEVLPDIFMYWGGSLIIMHPITEELPVTLGVDVSGYFMGSKSESYTTTSPAGLKTYQLTNVSSSMWPVHFIARVDPVKRTNFPVQPYAGLLLGFRVFNSRTKVDISYSYASETDTYKKRKINLTSSYGFELGAHIIVSKKTGLNLRYASIWGGWGKYIDFESLTFDDNGDPQYQRHETRTDIRVFSVGLVWLMGD
jgi:hypothetical protein